MKRGRTVGGTEKLQERLEETLAKGDFYEAAQLYKTIAARLFAKGDLEGAKTILLSGAERIGAINGHSAEAEELCFELLRSYVTPQDDGNRISEGIVRVVTKILSDHGSKRRLIQHLIAMYPNSKPAHQAMAEIASEVSELAIAQKHLILSGASGSQIASCVSKAACGGEPHEWDLFVARSVLICLTDCKDDDVLMIASDCFSSLCSEKPEISTSSPLLHVISHLLILIRLVKQDQSQLANASRVFGELKQKYSKVLKERDPEINELLEHTIQKYFQSNGPSSSSNAPSPTAAIGIAIPTDGGNAQSLNALGNVLSSIIHSLSSTQQSNQQQ